MQEVLAQIAELKTKTSDRSKGQEKSVRALVERIDQVEQEILEAAANSENAGRGTARRLDELDKLVPQLQNTDYKLEKAVERQQDADERLRQLTKDLKELAKRKPEKRPASAKKATGSENR